MRPASHQHLDTREGESVQTDTNSQPKKSSYRKRSLSKNAEIILKLTENSWWPFERVDGRLLERMHREKLRDSVEVAPI